ncbi:MAG: leucine-rich repeat protein [Clostridia bacterium]|nr:leucine-rich repeat protein [Clostridia bacterium]
MRNKLLCLAAVLCLLIFCLPCAFSESGDFAGVADISIDPCPFIAPSDAQPIDISVDTSGGGIAPQEYDIIVDDLATGDRAFERWFYENTYLNIPAYTFEAGHPYKIEVTGRVETADGETYFSNAATAYFICGASQDSRLVTTYGGLTGSFDWPVYKLGEIAWSWDTEGVQAVRVFEGDYCDYFPEADWGFYGGWGFIYSNPGQHMYFMQACYDENYDPDDPNAFEWVTGNVVFVNAYSNGALSSPTITAPASVKQGDMLRVTVTDPPQGVGSYSIDILAADGAHVSEQAYVTEASSGNVVIFPTWEVPVGEGYTVRVYCQGEGYAMSESNALPLTVEEANPDAPVLLLSKDEYAVNEPVKAFFYTPDAATAEFRLFFEEQEVFNDTYTAPLNYVIEPIWDSWSSETSGSGYAELEYKDDIGHVYTERADFSVVSKGSAPLPVLTVDNGETLTLGDDLTIRISNVPEGVYCDLYVYLNGDELIYEGSDSDDAHHIVWADWLERDGVTYGDIITIDLVASAEGYDSSMVTATVTVADRTVDENIIFSVNGAASGETSFMADEPVMIILRADGAEQAQYSCDGGDSWDEFWDWESGQTKPISTTSSFGWSRDPLVFIARAYYTDEETGDGEWRYSNTITAVTETIGALDSPTLTADETVSQGQPLHVTLGAVENADRYTAYAYSGQGGHYFFGEVIPGAFTLPTDVLAPGEYTLFITVFADGYKDSDAYTAFTVTEGEGIGENCLSVHKDTLLTGEYAIFSYSMPGATAVRLYAEDYGEWMMSEKSAGTFTGAFNEVCGRDFYVQGYVGDPDDEANWTLRSNTVHVTWDAPNGRLPEPEITLSDASPKAGEDLTFTVGAVEGAACTNINFGDISVWRTLYDGQFRLIDGQKSVTIPGVLIETWKTYRIRVDAIGLGYESSHSEYTVFIGPDGEPDAVLTANGEADAANILVNEDVRLVITAPETATGVILKVDGETWETAGGSRLETSYSFGNTGTHTVMAFYTTDEIDPDIWWGDDVALTGYSNAVTIRVNSYGQMPKPVISVTPSVPRGDAVTVHLENASEYAEFEGIVTWLNGYRYVEDEDYYDWINIDCQHEGTGDLTFSTAPLQAGETYYIQLGAGSVPGWENSFTDMTPFTVTEAAASVILTADSTSPLTEEYIYIAGMAIGAKGLRLYQSDVSDYSEVTGDYIRRGFSWNKSCDVTFTLKACYSDDLDTEANWMIVGEPLVVTVTAPYGSFPEPSFVMPYTVTPGETFDVTVTADPAFTWRINIYDKLYNRIVSENMDAETKTYTIDTTRMSENGMIRVLLSTYKTGYEGGFFERYVYILNGADVGDLSVMRLPADTRDIEAEAFLGSGAEIVVISGGCQTIGDMAFCNCPGLRYVVVPASVTAIGEYAFYGSPVTLVCPEGSAADRYAEAHGIPVLRSLDIGD